MTSRADRAILLIAGESDKPVGYQAALREHGLQVIGSTDPADAMRMSSRFPFTAAIIDGDLESMDVSDVIIGLRMRDGRLPILLIAGHQLVPIYILTEVEAVLRRDSLDAFYSKLDWVLELAEPKGTPEREAA